MTPNDYIKILAGFLTILLFATLDNAISPLVSVFRDYYQVPLESTLILISACTLGFAVGLFLGPAALSSFSPKALIGTALIGVTLGLLLFVTSGDFYPAVFSRALLGFSVGFISCTIWWVTYHAMSGKTAQHVMLTGVMTARPLGIALGVPAAGILSTSIGWKTAFTIFGVGLIAFASLLRSSIINNPERQSTSFYESFAEYKRACSQPFFMGYYGSIFLNSMAYLGLYGMGGIWFLTFFQLPADQISETFLFLGIAEVGATFLAPIILRLFPYPLVFGTSGVGAIFLYALLIGPSFPLSTSVAIMMAFIACTRIWIFSNASHIPTIFPSHKNKGTMGTLMTLFAWLGFAAVSWLQSVLIPIWGLNNVVIGQTVLLAVSIFWSFLVHRTLVFHAESA
ncbi:MAG: MFS transporter [Bdellovibrionales bacterium]|nr:MFS transporter [Bdellovibrionales bacterium]